MEKKLKIYSSVQLYKTFPHERSVLKVMLMPSLQFLQKVLKYRVVKPGVVFNAY